MNLFWHTGDELLEGADMAIAAHVSRTTCNDPREPELRDFAMKYPGASEAFPWGHRAIKVNRKTFVFMGSDGGGLHLSMKLPKSREAALMFDFAEPTHYGLGKSGWVSASFAARAKAPMDLLRAWIDESYRAIAPKKLVAELDGGASASKRAKKRKRSQSKR
jgi:predicted DNA-binding protein (MmcQ/YjbR family)